jgi:hypothetical protein
MKMKEMMAVTLGALVLMSAAASAQNRTARGTVVPPGTNNAAPPVIPAACSPCLWYSGDNDVANPNWDGLFNANATWKKIKAQTWVPFIAASDGNPLHKHVSISAVTFNELTNTPDTNPPADFVGMSYAFRTNVLSGKGGALGRGGPCPATSVVYTGLSPNGWNEYSYTCSLVSNPVKVAVGTIYWVNLMPTFNVSDYAYLSNAIDVPGLNQFGWGDDFYNSFFNSAYFGDTFAPATGLGSGFQEFSVAIAGTYVD